MTNKTMWMKVSAMLLAFLLVLPAGVLAVPEVVVPENVITNGTFADADGDGKADGWEYTSTNTKLTTAEGAAEALIPEHLTEPLPGYKGNYLQYKGPDSNGYINFDFSVREVKADTVYRGTVYYKGGNVPGVGSVGSVNVTPYYWAEGASEPTAVRQLIKDYNATHSDNPMPEYDCTPFIFEGENDYFKVSHASVFQNTVSIAGQEEDEWARATFVFHFSDFRDGFEEYANGDLGFKIRVSMYLASKVTFADFSLVESDEFMLNGDFEDGGHLWAVQAKNGATCEEVKDGETIPTPCHTFKDGVMTMTHSAISSDKKHYISLPVLPSTIYRLTYEATTSEKDQPTLPWVGIQCSEAIWPTYGTERTNANKPKSYHSPYQNNAPVAGVYDTYEFYFQTLPTEKSVFLYFYPYCVLPDSNRVYGLEDTLSIKNISLRMVTESELSLVDGTTRTELTSFSPENPVRVRGAYLTAADDANVQPMAAVYKETEDGTMQLISLQLGKTYAPATRSYDWQGTSWQPMNMIRFDEVFDFSGVGLPALGEGEDYTIQAFVFDSLAGITPLAKSAYVK